MARRYSFLRFNPGVDWHDVDPRLLVRMNQVGMYLGKVITITSGARGVPGHPNMGATHSHHVPANNPSGKGEAVDAYVGDKPLGEVISTKTAARFGLYSGNRPGFYKGKPDPEHFETLERRGYSYKGSTPSPQTASTGGGTTGTAAAAGGSLGYGGAITDLPDSNPQASQPPAPEETVPTAYAPGSVPAEGSVRQDPIETWRMIAAQPLASSDTQAFLSRLTGGQ